MAWVSVREFVPYIKLWKRVEQFHQLTSTKVSGVFWRFPRLIRRFLMPRGLSSATVSLQKQGFLTHQSLNTSLILGIVSCRSESKDNPARDITRTSPLFLYKHISESFLRSRYLMPSMYLELTRKGSPMWPTTSASPWKCSLAPALVVPCSLYSHSLVFRIW